MSHENSTIHTHSFEGHFTIVSNQIGKDEGITWAAKGLLLYLLGRPKDWAISVSQLATIYKGRKKGGAKDAIWAILKELREAKYIKYTKTKNARGTFSHRYDVYPLPYEEFEKINPHRDNPGMGDPGLDNPGLITKKEKTKKERTTTAAPKSVPCPKKEKPKPSESSSAPTAPVVVIYQILNENDIELSDKNKQKICSKYTEDQVIKAVTALRQSKTPVLSQMAWLTRALEKGFEPADLRTYNEKMADELQKIYEKTNPQVYTKNLSLIPKGQILAFNKQLANWEQRSIRAITEAEYKEYLRIGKELLTQKNGPQERIAS